jgi:DNA-binding CsgD family transcriptional regulator
LNHLHNINDTDPTISLSKREKEIFMLLLSGNRTKAIADKLNLKSNTISTVIKNLKAKTNAKTLVDLLNLGIKYGHNTSHLKAPNHKELLIDSGYTYSHAFEINLGKRKEIIRFEYWKKSNSTYLVEVVNNNYNFYFSDRNLIR